MEVEEGGNENLVQSQNMIDAKVVGKKGGGREGEYKWGKPSSQSNKHP